MDSTFNELLIAQHAEVKAWHLATSLGVRVFQDFAEPRNGTSISIRTERPGQVAYLISHGSLKSLDVMTSYKEINFVDHSSMEVEFVKFLTTKSPFEKLESMQK